MLIVIRKYEKVKKKKEKKKKKKRRYINSTHITVYCSVTWQTRPIFEDARKYE